MSQLSWSELWEFFFVWNVIRHSLAKYLATEHAMMHVNANGFCSNGVIANFIPQMAMKWIAFITIFHNIQVT